MKAYKMSREFPEKDSKIYLTGVKPVLEFLQSEPQRVDMVYLKKGRPTTETTKILDICREFGVRFSLVPEENLARTAHLSPEIQHQGVAARLHETARISYEDLLIQAFEAPLPLLVALDQVLDPGNVGTLARSLYAMGGAGLIVPRHNSAFLGPGARRSAAGALEHLPVAQVTNLARALQEAEAAGYHIYAAEGLNHDIARGNAAQAGTAGQIEQKEQGPLESSPCTGEKSEIQENAFTAHLHLPAVLVLGSEESGLRPLVRKSCTTGLAIPLLRNFDSLNVAQAGAILISCFLRAKLSGCTQEY